MRTPPRSVLIIVTRRIGDVLLATPLMRSVKRTWPDTAVDVLVFGGTQGVIARNPDVRRIITVPERPGFIQHAAFIFGLLRRYDVALSTLHGDRPTLYAFLAGRWRAGLLNDTPKERWKQSLLQHWLPFDDRETHTVRMNLALATTLAIEPHYEIVVSWGPEDRVRVDALVGSGSPLAVLHPYPKFNYKMWRRAGWIETAAWLVDRGYRVALSGGREADEAAYVADLARDMAAGTLNLAGQLNLGEVGSLLSRAAVYVGPDTAITHMAAALGVPTVALYGPTNCVKWGPWPRDYSVDANPWRRHGTQRQGNVTLLQGDGACVPCHLEGCDRHIGSYSDCLQQLPAARVIAALEEVVGSG